MPTLTEARIQKFIDHAQHTLFLHDHYRHQRDQAYREVMSLVDELVDLMLEVRRERAALERIAEMWEECVVGENAAEVGRECAARMGATARQALGLPLHGRITHLG